MNWIMASESSNNTGISSIFSSHSGKLRWVHQMKKNFEKELKIDIYGHSHCISRVPETLRAEKPEAYAPKRIGLGPYHHFRLDLYQMEREKLVAAKKVLTPDQIVNFQQFVVNTLVKLEPTLRACYSDYLDLAGDTLAWIWAIDGLFLHYYLRNWNRSVDSSGIKLAQDIFMLENQIPLNLLEEIQKAIQAQPPCANVKGKMTVFVSDGAEKWPVSNAAEAEVIYNFCKAHSPLELMEFRLYRFEHKPVHLLDFMYHLIVNYQKPVVEPLPLIIMSASESIDFLGNTQKMPQISSSSGIGGPAVQALPWENICSPVKKTDIDGNRSPVDKIEIPSVSSLQNIVGMKFTITEVGIRGIEFDKKTLTLLLPVITLNDNSEVILRNLVAYEALSMPVGSTLMLAEYVDLMCGIIATVEDVKILHEQGIIVIKDSLSYDQIAYIFNGIKKSTGEDKKSTLERAIDEVIKQYESSPRVKACRFVKKCWDSSCNFVQASWKVLSFLLAIALILLLTLQAFCDVYGCSNSWFGKIKAKRLRTCLYFLLKGMKLAQDIFMLENQISFILLEEIQKAIRTEPPCANDKGKTTVIVSNDS